MRMRARSPNRLEVRPDQARKLLVIGAALEILAEGIQEGNGQPLKSRLWELSEGLSLGDISIRELIEEGRE